MTKNQTSQAPVSNAVCWVVFVLFFLPLNATQALPPPDHQAYRPAAKQLSDCTLCDLFGTFKKQQEEEEKKANEEIENRFIAEPTIPPQAVQEAFELSPFYQQWVSIEGYSVLSLENVNPYALKEAAWIIRQMMRHRPNIGREMTKKRAGFP